MDGEHVDFSRSDGLRGEALYAALSPHMPGDALEGFAREVVARLARRARKGAAGRVDAVRSDVEQLADLLLAPSLEPSADFVQSLLSGGVPVDDIYLTYLSGAACRLGALWDESRLSFTEVTLGVGRIYALLRAIRPGLAKEPGRCERCAIFANVPGENHTLGVSMAADLFRRAGWEIDLKLGLSHDQLVAEVERSDVRLVGLSAGAQSSLPALARLILALRIAKSDAYVVVGGRLVQQSPEVLAPLDADAITADVATAMKRLGTLSDMFRPA